MEYKTYLTLNQWSKAIHECAVNRGFYTLVNNLLVHKSGNLTAQIMLVVTELAEAVEVLRMEGEDSRKFDEELIDALIRLLDILGYMRIDVDGETARVMSENEHRPQMHGKRF